MTDTRYHQLLRISLLVTAFVLVFQSGLVFPITKQLSVNTAAYLANSVGVLAQIEPNEFNTLASELNAREQELNAREAALRDIESRNFSIPTSSDFSTFILATILFILTVLIVTNYVLDWRRAQSALS